MLRRAIRWTSPRTDFSSTARGSRSQIYQQTQRYAVGATFPLTVGEGQVFVLGDARENATDSRVYGAVEVKDTLGKVITILRRRDI